MEIKIYPDPILRQTSKTIDNFSSPELKDTIKKMFEIMYECGGIGLAGPQAGLSQRIIVANLEASAQNKNKEVVYINPKILKRSGEIIFEEGCLSLPGIRVNMTRKRALKVEYYDLVGEKHVENTEDLLSVLFQHEIDHIDGILIVDRMSMSQKTEFRTKIMKFEDDFAKGIKRPYKDYALHSEDGL